MAFSVPIKQIWKTMTESSGYDQVLKKINLISVENGFCSAEMKVADEHVNMNGILHGGLIATIVDVISGMALVTNENNPVGVSVDLHISFLNAVALGNQILIEAKTNKVGKTLAFLEVLIKDKTNEKVVARGLHTKFVANR